MATLLDAFFIEIGFDTKGMQSGAEQADNLLKKTQDKAKKAADEIDQRTKLTTEFAAKLRDQIILLYAAFTGGKDIEAFVSQITSADAALGRAAYTMDESTRTLGAWRGMATLVGGTAEGITATMGGLIQKLEEWSLTGSSTLLPFFRRMGIPLVDPNTGKMIEASEVYMRMADFFKGWDPARASAMMKLMGLDDTSIMLILQGRDALQAYMAEMKKYAASDADIAAAKERQKAWAEFDLAMAQVGRRLLTQLTPAIVSIANALKAFADWALKHPRVIEAAFAGIGAAVIALSAIIGIGLVAALAALAGGGEIILGVAIAVGQLAAAGTFLVRHWDEIAAWWHKTWNAMTDDVKRAWQYMEDHFGLKWIEKHFGIVVHAVASHFAAVPTPQSATAAPRGADDGVLGLVRRLESSGDQAVSPKGAIGRYQIEPGTARQYGFDPSRLGDPTYNAVVASAILADLSHGFRGDLASILIGYNAGPGWARRWNAAGRDNSILPGETQRYLAHARRLGYFAGGVTALLPAVSGARHSSSVSTLHSTTIGTIVVHTMAKTPAGIASAVRDAITNNNLVQQGNYGSN